MQSTTGRRESPMSQTPTRKNLSEKGQQLLKQVATWLEENAKSDKAYSRTHVEQGHQFLVCRADSLKKVLGEILPDLLNELEEPVCYISSV